MANVHFVGGVALDWPGEVFAAIGQHCGPYLKRVPDGEPGGRRLWISFQIPVLRANPSLTPVGQTIVPLKLADGSKPEDIHFGELGYAREARPSYEDFLTSRSAGQLPAGVRFQVSLPTPWAVVMPFVQQPDARQVYPAYERAMLREVAANFQRLAAAVPSGVELGFHLCYGDLDARHFVQPVDATKLVEMANLIARNVQRPIQWVHMPVPIDRTDDAYFAPLKDLQLQPGTELYLGLVHAQDGIEGTKKRIAAAKKYVLKFGIGSECGISRGRNADLAMDFIKTYAAAAATA